MARENGIFLHSIGNFKNVNLYDESSFSIKITLEIKNSKCFPTCIL
jgi:hypothetical protein